jgi:hypothetical protein
MKKRRLYDHPLGLINRRKIVNAILELDNPTPGEIRRLFKNKIQDSETYYQHSFIHNKANLKKGVPSEKTIHTHLNNLVEEQLVEHKNNRYSIKNKFVTHVEIFLWLYSRELFQSIWSLPFPKSEDKFFAEIVNRFGTFIVYQFLVCLQPHEHISAESEKQSLEALRQNWSTNVIPLSLMFYSFRKILGLVGGFRSDIKSYEYHELSQDEDKELFEMLSKKYPYISNRLAQMTREIDEGPLVRKLLGDTMLKFESILSNRTKH